MVALRSRLRWKIVVPYALLSLFVAFAGTTVVARTVTGSLDDRFTNQLVESARVMEDAVVRQEKRHLESVRAVAFTQGVGEATATGDVATLADLVLPIAANTGAARIDVLDNAARPLLTVVHEGGRPVVRAGTAASAPDATADPVARALDVPADAPADKFAGIVDVDGVQSMLTTGPIRVDGRTVGVVAVSTRLDAFIAVASQEVLAQITVFDSGLHPLASTFPGEELAAATTLPSSDGEAVIDGSRQRLNVAGRGYEQLYGTLQVRGEPVGRYSVALSTSFIASAQDRTRWQMIVLFAGLTLGVLVVGFMVARYLTAPLTRLVGAALALGRGDMTTRAPISTIDEVGTLSLRFNEMAERLERQHRETIAALVSAIDARDPYTRGHSVRVGELSVEIGRSLGLPVGDIQHLRIGGFLHDIGKIGIRDAVLLKPGELSPEERELIEQHPQIGLNILSSIELPSPVRAIVGQHHERLDGSGYPLSLTTDQLTLFPRIAAVSDVYDALVTDRPYRHGLSSENALYVLRREAFAGILDPDVVNAMVKVAREWEERWRDDPILGNVARVQPNLGPGVPPASGEMTGGQDPLRRPGKQRSA